MSASKIVAGIALWMTAAIPLVAQKQHANVPHKSDARIVAAMQKVSAERLRKNDEKLVSFGTRHTLSVQLPAEAAGGITKAAAWIKEELESYSKACGGCLEVKMQTETQEKANRIPEPIQLTNVYAVMRGTDPESAKRIFVISGHYDSRNSETNDYTKPAPGANDDASGTITVLETARVLSQYKFPATIVFLAVAGEEQGLYGSKQFAKMAKANGWNIEAVLNNDIVGGDKSPGQDATKVRVFSEGVPSNATPEQIRKIRGLGEENDSTSREVARYVSEIGGQYSAGPGFRPVMVFRPDRYLRGGDHLSFNEEGFAAVRFTEWQENFNHQHQTLRTENGIEYGDLPKFVDFGYVARVAKLEVAVLASLASGPPPPARPRLLTKSLENDSQLAWDASPAGQVAYYEVVWRSTTEPTWNQGKKVGTATTAKLPVSKDNVVFGIRAVDAQGHRSIVVTPVPER